MQWIDHAKIAAALAVVILHVAAGVLSWNAVGTEFWWCGNLYNALVRWCVPVFVMVSGALLLDGDKQEPIEVFYKKRLARVLVPLLFWSLLFMSWTFAKGALRGEPPPLSGLLQSVLRGQPFYHLWYLYMIPGLYLLTPFLRKITATSSRRELTWLIAATFALSAINQLFTSLTADTPTLFLNWMLLYLPYFFLGHYIRTDPHTPAPPMLWGIFLLACAATFFGTYLTGSSQRLTPDYMSGYLSVSVIPMSISSMYLLKSWQRPLLSKHHTSAIATLTFGVFLVHPLLLEIANHLGLGAFDYGHGRIKLHPALAIPVVAMSVFAVALGAAWVIGRMPLLRRTI